MNRESGFSLIEVMVTLALVSVAALGMAGLQTVTLRASNTALVESQAVTLAQDIIERVRANPAGDYQVALNQTLSNQVSVCRGTGANCDATAMAGYDLMHWKCSLGSPAIRQSCINQGIAGQLPQGDGTIQINGGVYTITIQWFDAASNSNRSLVISTVI